MGDPQQPHRRKDSPCAFCVEQGRMVLLHGFIKKTQKTPAREIDMAVSRMKGGG